MSTACNNYANISLNLLAAFLSSVSNGSNQLERFWVRVGTGTELFQRFLPHQIPEHCNWASFST
jgi:hypothetical protein